VTFLFLFFAYAHTRVALINNSKHQVVKLHNPINENINMNQVLSHVDIRIEDGNPQAQGVYARAAQGTSVQDVFIYAGTAACGLVGGAGASRSSNCEKARVQSEVRKGWQMVVVCVVVVCVCGGGGGGGGGDLSLCEL
jgi:hypothetical protein